jgi:DNA gyrase subunit B
LTFFYRQMPELIEKGYLYIAQPPLYRAKRGQSEVYLKDDRALDDYLSEGGLADAILKLGDGRQIGSSELRALTEQARQVKSLLTSAATKVPVKVLEQVAIAQGFTPGLINDLDAAAKLAQTIAARLDALELPTERGWQGKVVEGEGFAFLRLLRGVTENHQVDSSVLRSAEARRLHELGGSLHDIYEKTADLMIKEKSNVITGPVALLDTVLEAGRKGIGIQRYKGLGEMNPDQLWETTLDPNVRSLLQVKVAHIEQAEEVFSTLMGDVVEPRRDFIQANALKVANLDV